MGFEQTTDITIKRDKTSGMIVRGDSKLSYDKLLNQFTISPSTSSFEFWSYNKKFKKTVAETIDIPVNLSENIIAYYDENGDVQFTDDLSYEGEVSKNSQMIAFFVVNLTLLQVIGAVDLRFTMLDVATRNTLTAQLGTTYKDGLALENIVADGSGNSDLSAQFSIENGNVFYADFNTHIADGEEQQLSLPAQLPIAYKIGSEWKIKDKDDFAMIYGGSVGADYSGSRIAYNPIIAGMGSLQEVSNNDYTLVHIFAGSGISSKVFGVMGQNVYANVTSARNGAEKEMQDLTVNHFISDFYIPIASIILQSSNSYNNIPKSRIISTGTGEDYVDFRFVKFASGGGIEDAPIDGNTYGRKDGVWGAIAETSGGASFKATRTYNYYSSNDTFEPLGFNEVNRQTDTSIIEQDPTSDEKVLIKKDGWYKLDVNLNFNAGLSYQLYINGVDYARSLKKIGEYNATGLYLDSNFCEEIELNAGDIIEFRFRRLPGNTVTTTIEPNGVLIIKEV